jgi:ABC-2 type transport system permease protein
MDTSYNMVGLRAMLRFSTKKLLLHRRWVMIALLAVLVGAAMGYAATQPGDPLVMGSDLLELLVLTFLLPVLAMIYGASMIRNEIDDRSITQVITSPIDRRVAYIGYYLSVVGVLAVMLLALDLVGWSSFFLLTTVDAGAIGLLLSYSAVLVLGAVVYSSLFLALGVVLKQPMYIGLFYAFVWEGFIGSLPGAIGEYTIKHQLAVIASALIDKGHIASYSGDAVGAALVLVAVTVFLLVLGAMAFREKEVA